MSVYKKLMAARIELHGTKITKSGENAFAHYRYMELGDFLIPTQQIFQRLGLCGVISFTSDVASLTITDTETDKQIVITSPMGSAALKGCHEVQNIGAVQTYQRRYLWVAAMEIVEHDAIDSTPPVEKSKAPSFKSSPTMGVLAGLKPDRQAVIHDAAQSINDRFAADDVPGAHELYFDFVDDERTGLWSLLDSKKRAAIKKYEDFLKQPLEA